MSLSIKKTEAAILSGSRAPLIIDEITLPERLLSGQILVEVITSGICGAQINEIDGVKGEDRFLPHLLGHEGFARVIELAPDVTKVNPGDLVIMHWRQGSGTQSKPPIYEWRGKNLNAGWVTTFNKHSIVSENRITKIDPGLLDKNILPLLGCALPTALGVLENDIQANFRDSMIIIGCGGVGLSVIKIAQLFGIKDITAIDIKKEKLTHAEKMGASKTLLFTGKIETIDRLKNLYGNSLPNIAVETTGNSEAIELCYEITSSTAKVVLVGVPKIGDMAKIHTLPLHFGKILKGSYGGHSNPDRDIPDLLRYLIEKKIDFSDYPTKSFTLSNVNQAINEIRDGVPGRMILDFSMEQ